MISIFEIVRTDLWDGLDPDHKLNLQHLHYAVNSIRSHFKFPLIINNWTSRRNSGYRTLEDHFATYKVINDKRLKEGKPVVTPPMKSMHLSGSAADLYDPRFMFKRWALDNLHHFERLDLYMEDFDATGGLNGGWAHLQTMPTVSGKRFFNP